MMPSDNVIKVPAGWTPERIELLTSLWGEGLTVTEIAERLDVTRGAVVGKVDRLQLPKRPSPIRPPRHVQRQRPFPSTDQPHEPVGCRWIDGDVQEGDWRYCQAPQKTGSSYCEHHHPRCYRRANAEEVA